MYPYQAQHYIPPFYGTQWPYPAFQYGYPYPGWGNWNPYAYRYPHDNNWWNNHDYSDWNNDDNGYDGNPQLKDYGSNPFVINIEQASRRNRNYRTALWTGKHLQVTLMSIGVGEDIGLEVHPDVDQFIRIEQGRGVVRMGQRKDRLDFQREVGDDDAIMVPAGTWHNVVNTGHVPLKLYTIYAPPEHPFGTVHRTKEEAHHSEAQRE